MITLLSLCIYLVGLFSTALRPNLYDPPPRSSLHQPQNPIFSDAPMQKPYTNYVFVSGFSFGNYFLQATRNKKYRFHGSTLSVGITCC